MMEMMIIIVVIGVLAAMAVPSFLTMMPRLKLKSDARTMINYLRTARSRAIAENNQYGIYFDANNSRLILFKDTNDPTGATYNAGQDSVIDSSATLNNGVAFGAVSFTNNSVVFFSSGAAAESGSLILSHCDVARYYTVNVLASTGKVAMQ
jgi:Tfp pilus assembly protein FimT